SATDAAIRRDIVAVRIPRAGRRVVAEVEGDKRRAGFNQSTGDESLLAPQVIAVASARRRRLALDVEGLLRPAAQQNLHCLLAIAIHRVHHSRAIEIVAERVETAQQCAPLADALVRDAERQLKKVGLGTPAGVDADVGVYRQTRRLIGDERIVLPAEIAAES